VSGLNKRKPKVQRGESKTSPRRVIAKERTAQAIELRIAGAKYRVIAETLGYASEQAAHKAVSEALAQAVREPARQLIEIELHRLDALMLAIWPAARRGVLGAVDRAIRIMERRAKLLGLDAPIMIEWQREAANAGFDPAATFEELVQYFSARMVHADGDSSPAGSGEENSA
jgi:hypothetical protein